MLRAMLRLYPHNKAIQPHNSNLISCLSTLAGSCHDTSETVSNKLLTRTTTLYNYTVKCLIIILSHVKPSLHMSFPLSVLRLNLTKLFWYT